MVLPAFEDHQQCDGQVVEQKNQCQPVQGPLVLGRIQTRVKEEQIPVLVKPVLKTLGPEPSRERKAGEVFAKNVGQVGNDRPEPTQRQPRRVRAQHVSAAAPLQPMPTAKCIVVQAIDSTRA